MNGTPDPLAVLLTGFTLNGKPMCPGGNFEENGDANATDKCSGVVMLAANGGKSHVKLDTSGAVSGDRYQFNLKVAKLMVVEPYAQVQDPDLEIDGGTLPGATAMWEPILLAFAAIAGGLATFVFMFIRQRRSTHR